MTDSKDKPSEPTGKRPEEISASRRGFFREMLILGLDGLEKQGRRVGQRFADAVEKADRAKETQPKPPILKLDRDERTEGRGQMTEGKGQEAEGKSDVADG
jgi:hypothetical protein